MLNSIKWIFKWQKPNYVNTLQSVTVVEHIQVAKVCFFYFLLSLMYLMLFMFSQDDHVKKETECSETSGTSQGRTIKRKTRSLIFQRRGAEHTLDVFALADLDWVYLLWALLINTLGKQLAELLCTVISPPPPLPLVIGEHGGLCPQLSGRWCFAGICGTENQAIYREHSSLRSSS